jgi:hypothetical protein
MTAVFAVVVVAGALFATWGGAHRGGGSSRPTSGPSPPGPAAPQPTTPAASTDGWVASPPATVVPPATAVQQQEDQALATGLGSSASVSAAEAANVAGPATSEAWPALAVSSQPDVWTEQFVRSLLDIDFAHQSRAGLGGWLSAEEAPELLPGVPEAVQNKALYLSLFDIAAVGGGVSPVLSAAGWRAAAAAGVVWTVSDLLVQADPQWSQIVATGWQPADEHFSVEDVSGLLRTTRRGQSTAHHFSMAVYLGSAHWHAGYGTMLVNDWQES